MGRRGNPFAGNSVETSWTDQLQVEMNGGPAGHQRPSGRASRRRAADIVSGGGDQRGGPQSQHAALGRMVVADQLIVVRRHIAEVAPKCGFKPPQIRDSVGLSYIAQSRLDSRRRDRDVASPAVRRVSEIVGMLIGVTDRASSDIQPTQPVYCAVSSQLTAVAADPAANNMPPGSFRINVALTDDKGLLEAEHRRVQELVYPTDAAEERVAGRFDGGYVDLTLAVVEPAHRGADLSRLLTPELGLPRRIMLAPLSVFDVQLADIPEAC